MLAWLARQSSPSMLQLAGSFNVESLSETAAGMKNDRSTKWTRPWNKFGLLWEVSVPSGPCV